MNDPRVEGGSTKRRSGRDRESVTKQIGMRIGIIISTIGGGETVVGDLSMARRVRTREWMEIRDSKESGWIPNGWSQVSPCNPYAVSEDELQTLIERVFRSIQLYVGGNGGSRRTSKAGGVDKADLSRRRGPRRRSRTGRGETRGLLSTVDGIPSAGKHVQRDYRTCAKTDTKEGRRKRGERSR